MKKIYGLMMALLTVTVMQGQVTLTELNDKNGDAVKNPYYFTEYNGKVYFQASGQYGQELYVTDGTQNGTEVIDIYEGSYVVTKNVYDENSNLIGTEDVTYQNESSPSGFFMYNDELYFSTIMSDENGAVAKQYKYNSTTGSLTVVDETQNFKNPMVVGENIYFINGSNNLVVYSAGSVTDVPSTGQTHYADKAIYYNGNIIFYGDVDGSEATTGYELCKYDIGSEQFVFVANIDNNTYGPGWARDAFIENFTIVDDKLYFSGDYNDSWLWETEGTEITTVKVDLANTITGTDNYYVWGGKIYFKGNDGTGQLFSYDPDETSPSLTNLSNFDGFSSTNHNPINFCEYNNALYYQGANGSELALYKTDGSGISQENASLEMYSAIGKLGDILLVNGREANEDKLFVYAPTPTAIVDEISDNAITVSPNPSYGYVHVEGIESAMATYELYDLSGKCIEKGVIGSSNQINYSVGAGMYILKVVDTTNTKLTKILVK
ncbi:T9SS type A sorting domain-containing protein [Carboxylicivirga sp. RSCT41]|uniref:T9SS type A sorting domain-containing protein n=1 Tax=Carboxylicivirga agarovorans TaxID=3417570 RepID=UPI003D34CC34